MLRFCRARKWDHKKAKEQFVNALKWRKSFGAEDIKDEDINPALLEAGAFYFNSELDPYVIRH